MKVPRWLLEQRQGMPLQQKIELSQAKVREWYEHWDGMVYVAFSGGKDSTVLLHLVRGLYPEVPAVFSDTGLEYPELKESVKSYDNVTVVRPKMSFRQVLEQKGYPVISKKVSEFVYNLQNESESNQKTCHLRRTGYTSSGRYCPSLKLPEKWMFLVDAPFKISHQCCKVMKKLPLNGYVKESGRHPMLGMMASESMQRERTYTQYGCNLFDARNPVSWPMAFWTSQDVLRYIVENELSIPSVYGEIMETDNGFATTGLNQTGCIFCCFGIQHDGELNRFQRMKESHPKLWEYCLDDLGFREVLDYIGVPYE